MAVMLNVARVSLQGLCLIFAVGCTTTSETTSPDAGVDASVVVDVGIDVGAADRAAVDVGRLSDTASPIDVADVIDAADVVDAADVPDAVDASDAGTDASGLAAGEPCSGDAMCATGLLCCYPCGIPGCVNRCSAPFAGTGRCPLLP